MSRKRILQTIVLPLLVMSLLRSSGLDGLARLMLGIVLFAWLAYLNKSDQGLSADPTLGLHETRTPSDEDPRLYTPL